MVRNKWLTTSPSAKEIQLPVATAHFLMDSEPDPPNESIPSWWKNMNFKAVDVLNISPFIVNTPSPENKDKDKDGAFILEPHYEKTGIEDSAKRLASVIDTARTQNPTIKIIGVQWWGENNKTLAYLGTDERINNYVRTVGEIIEEWTLDGWDIDYEWNESKMVNGKETNPPPGNLVPTAPKILHLIRERLEGLQDTLKRPLYVTMSAATTECLDTEVSKSVHFVNVQTYAGGLDHMRKNSLDDWINLGFTNKQLLCGICPENTPRGYSPTLPDTFNLYEGQGLAGIMSWRLNGGQVPFSNAVQAVIYNYLHPEKKVPEKLDWHKLHAMWEDVDLQKEVT